MGDLELLTEGEKGLIFQKAGEKPAQRYFRAGGRHLREVEQGKKSVLLFVFSLDLSGVLSLGSENRKQNSPNSPMYALLFLKSY